MQQQQQQMPQPQFSVEGGHLVMFHQEPTGLPMMKDANVNDRDRMQDLLAQEKYLTGAYNVAMYEAGHDDLFQVIKQNSDTCHDLQRQIFNTMFKKGWYRLPIADADSVVHTFNHFSQIQTQMPFPPGQQRTTMVNGQAQATQQMQQQVQQAQQMRLMLQAQQMQQRDLMQQAQQPQQGQTQQPQQGQTQQPQQGHAQGAQAGNTSVADRNLQQAVDRALHEAAEGNVPRGPGSRTH